LGESSDSKVTWITCPDCGAKIGIVISVGKDTSLVEKPVAAQTSEAAWPPTDINQRLSAVGVDLSLVNVEEGEDMFIVSPKKFLGDLWGPINDAIKKLNGVWIREGRQSRWEIKKQA
jgi:hypothetical protein